MSVPSEGGFMYTQDCEGGVTHELSHADGEALVCASLCYLAGRCAANGMLLEGRQAVDQEAHLVENFQQDKAE